MLQIVTNSLKAAVTMAATKDVRYYLLGVEILVREGGAVHLRATDGVVAFEDVMPGVFPTVPPCSIIVPLAAAKLAAKSKGPSVELVPMADGKYALGENIFTPIEGRFPDCDRIFPLRSDVAASVHHYDLEQLARCQTAMRLATAKGKHFYRLQHGPVGLVRRENDTFPRCALQSLSLGFGDN